MAIRFLPIQLCSALISCVLAAANPAVAQGGGASITLQPVQPQTIPPSSYPPGTTIVGQEIILGSVPARVWIDVHLTGWTPAILKEAHVAIAARDTKGDGGGFFGANAECLGNLAAGGGDIYPAMQSCSVPGATGNLDCRADLSGLAVPCQLGEPTRCIAWNGVSPGNYFPPGYFCEPFFQNECHPSWIGNGVLYVNSVDPHLDVRFGIFFELGQTPPDSQPSYLGTFVLDVPASAKGTYTIDIDQTQTYLRNPEAQTIPASLFPALITAPCGSCCSGYLTGNLQCADRVSASQCPGNDNQAFTNGALCSQSGGPECPQCAADINCDDGLFCNGQEGCMSNLCIPRAAPCRAYEECDEASDSCLPRIPAVSTWGLVVLGCLLLILAKLSYRRAKIVSLVLIMAATMSISESALAQGSGATITLQPVQPQTNPPSFYPPGTTIVGQEIILGSVPARVWIEIHVTGWEPYPLKTVQARIAANDDDQDGGGYSGSNADCLGSPAIGAGNLLPAQQACAGPGAAGNLDCRANLSGLPAPCPVGEPSRCIAWNGVSPGPYFPPGNFCEPWFQNRCHPRWIGTGIVFTNAIDIGSFNVRFGGTADLGQTIPDFHPSYLGTLMLDVPANAKGTYTIDFDEIQTYLQDPQAQNIPVSTYSARVTIACGRCCFGYDSGNIQCEDHLVAGQCESGDDQVFIADQACSQSGGPDCPQCAADSNCDDGTFCNGQEACDPSGECRSGKPPCAANEKCIERTDTCNRAVRKNQLRALMP